MEFQHGTGHCSIAFKLNQTKIFYMEPISSKAETTNKAHSDAKGLGRAKSKVIQVNEVRRKGKGSTTPPAAQVQQQTSESFTCSLNDVLSLNDVPTGFPVICYPHHSNFHRISVLEHSYR